MFIMRVNTDNLKSRIERAKRGNKAAMSDYSCPFCGSLSVYYFVPKESVDVWERCDSCSKEFIRFD